MSDTIISDPIVALKSGVRIHFDVDIMPEHRLRLSDGICSLDADMSDNLGYRPSAFIPQLPWQLPTPESLELSIYRSVDLPKIDLSETIGVIKIPDPILDEIVEIFAWGNNLYGIHHLNINDISLHSNYHQAIDKITTYISQYYSVDRDVQSLGLNRTEIDKITTTVDRLNFLPKTPYVGLHLDSHEKLPLRRRHFSKQRICINLGQEPRYFLFINRTLLQVFGDLNLVDPDDFYKDYRGVHLPEQFMTNCHRYPVTSLTIYPGEAYIAPTENIIHDATSMGKQLPDWSLTLLGKFKLADG